ncbi:MAG: nucleoside-diphosphate-sugar epimerase [Glaciecola sp.]|jgi:nucleoside-diphosphate-sugar epimerase
MHKHFIIGLGWLGSPLAKHFIDAGDVVAGTTRDKQKARTLTTQGIATHLYDLYHSDVNLLPVAAIANANIVVNIPPGRRDFSHDLFVQAMKLLFDYLAQNNAKHICFISTTSVFENHAGCISNNSLLSPNTPSGKAHVELELYLKSMAVVASNDKNIKTPMLVSVLRLAGLVSGDRHPITSLSKKSEIPLGKNPVNLIHQQDVIRVISALLSLSNNKDLTSKKPEVKKASENTLIPNFFAGNLCSTEHPSRESYYTWCAQQLNIRLPGFAADTRALADGKFIDSAETLNKLDIELTYSSPYQMLPSLLK